LIGFAVLYILSLIVGTDDYGSRVNGPIPGSIANLTQLQFLSFWNCWDVNLDTKSLSILSKLKSLRKIAYLTSGHLDLSFAALNYPGTTLPSDFLKTLSNLTYLDISGNGFIGQVPQTFASLPLRALKIVSL
jgi:hypothetical protein